MYGGWRVDGQKMINVPTDEDIVTRERKQAKHALHRKPET